MPSPNTKQALYLLLCILPLLLIFLPSCPFGLCLLTTAGSHEPCDTPACDLAMSAKLIPPNPTDVSVLRKVTENILIVSAPFRRYARFKIGGRGTYVRLPSGNVAVFSPTALTTEVRAAVAELGTVKYITALDAEHHIFLGAWHAAYPSATVIAPEGLPEKRQAQGNEAVRFDVVFTAKEKATQTVDEEFDAAFDYEYVDGHLNKELVFNFRRDRTLIQADLVFNLPAIEQYSRSKEDPHAGFWTRVFNSLQNTSGNAQRRFIWYFGTTDRPSFNASVARIDKWDFDRMIPCHGDVIESGAKGVFRKVLAWNLQAAEKGK